MALKHALWGAALAFGMGGIAMPANAGSSGPVIPTPTWHETGDAGGSTGNSQQLLGGNTLYRSITGFVGGGGDSIGPGPTAIDISDTFKFHWDGGAALTGFFDCIGPCTIEATPETVSPSFVFVMSLLLLDSGGSAVGGKTFNGGSFSYSNNCDDDFCVLTAGDYYFQVIAGTDPPYFVALSDRLSPDLGLRGFDVPEPGMLALFGLGLAGLGALRRKVS